MSLHAQQPKVFNPAGVSDALYEPGGFPGCCASLTNLILDPTTRNTWICRPAATLLTNFSGFTTPGQISLLTIIGRYAYGLISSGRNIGKDEPFVYDLIGNAFLTVTGITSTNSPTTQPTTGDWTPPTAAQIGARLYVTHPGFSTAGALNDQQTVSITGAPTGGTFTLAFTTTIGLNAGTQTATIQWNSTAAQMQTQLAALTNINAGNVVCSGGPLPATPILVTFQSQLGSNAQAVMVPNSSLLTGGSSPTASVVHTQTGAQGVYFGWFDISTISAPVWNGGNTTGFPLTVIPTAVAQFSDRAYFAENIPNTYSSVYFTDTGSNNITYGTQILTFGDTVPILALHGMPFTNMLGGIVQSLLVFKGSATGVYNIYQITGDASQLYSTTVATGTTVSNLFQSSLNVNALNVATTTLAPNTICATPDGIMFISPDGMRLITWQGQITPPIGQNGKGVNAPFIYATTPSRMNAAAIADTIRISLQNNLAPNQPWQEFWYDIGEKNWSGPHTFPSDLIASWGNSFVMAPHGIPAALYRSDVQQSALSTFVENGTQMTFLMQTSQMGDDGQMHETALVESEVQIGLPAAASFVMTAIDETMGVVGQAAYMQSGTQSFWDVALWDVGIWTGTASGFFKRRMDWKAPVVYRNLVIQYTGNCALNLRIGATFLREQVLGYMQQNN